jgi:hypothetical protein
MIDRIQQSKDDCASWKVMDVESLIFIAYFFAFVFVSLQVKCVWCD